ncbi:MAG: class I SAM-dependent methyltransferase [Solirubrobacteraceae bacterium]
MPEYLLHSLASFEPLITDVLDAAGARRVAEVGGEGGAFTEQLTAWADRVDGDVHCIDPAPSVQLVRLAERATRLRLIRDYSPAALERLPALDAYILDGDHNYWTVDGELRALHARLTDPEHPGVVILHDVAWPSARRDAYYAPERLPAEAVHPHSYTGGAQRGAPELREDGFSPAGRWAYARTEGGPRNGVLTAVEDFVADRPGLELHVVPAVFGLGVLLSSSAPWADSVRNLVAPYQLPLIARMEDNRIDLYLQVLRLQRELERRSRVHQLQLEHAASRQR